MSVTYAPVLWNRDKKKYDLIMLSAMVGYLVLFTVAHLLIKPNATIEIMLIRAMGTLAFVMLHLILCIGPLCRLNTRFLPLLYNRRHLGVAMFFIALGHGVFALFLFHAFGNVDPLTSLFSSNDDYTSLVRFPFQVLGFYALIILFLMAATSHDFWLKNLSPAVWKALHMCVYLAYVLLVGHVILGVIQLESHPVIIALVLFGVALVTGLHVYAGWFKKRKAVKTGDRVYVCKIDEIADDRAKVITVGNEEIAIFKYDSKLSAVHNVCRHQLGPLGEGKIVDGCITCPWHGYQYQPENGCSPPPFTEKVSTYQLYMEGDEVFVDPGPLPEGTFVEPIKFE